MRLANALAGLVALVATPVQAAPAQYDIASVSACPSHPDPGEVVPSTYC